MITIEGRTWCWENTWIASKIWRGRYTSANYNGLIAYCLFGKSIRSYHFNNIRKSRCWKESV